MYGAPHDEIPSEAVTRIYARFARVHVPLLDETAVIDYDPDRRRIEDVSLERLSRRCPPSSRSIRERSRTDSSAPSSRASGNPFPLSPRLSPRLAAPTSIDTGAAARYRPFQAEILPVVHHYSSQ